MGDNFVMVFPDNETYSPLPGCKIVFIPDNISTEDIEEYLKYPAKTVVTFNIWGGAPELETYAHEIRVNGQYVSPGGC